MSSSLNEPDDWLRIWSGPDLSDVVSELRVAARPDLVQETPGAELKKLFETRPENRLVGIELGWNGPPWTVSSRLLIHVAVELAGPDPVVDRAAAHAEAVSEL